MGTPQSSREHRTMQRFLVVAASAGISFLPSSAKAQERLGDGAMGAPLAGVLVGGPIGLVAGGVVGYTTGPAIASSWDLKGHRHYRRARHRRGRP
jgi:hypothetical protein